MFFLHLWSLKEKVLALTLPLTVPVCNTQLWENVLIIPESLHLGLLLIFIPLGMKPGVLKSQLATQGHREVWKSAVIQAFHLLPTSRRAFKLIVLSPNVNRGNAKHIQSWTCHQCTRARFITFQTIASSLRYFSEYFVSVRAGGKYKELVVLAKTFSIIIIDLFPQKRNRWYYHIHGWYGECVSELLLMHTCRRCGEMLALNCSCSSEQHSLPLRFCPAFSSSPEGNVLLWRNEGNCQVGTSNISLLWVTPFTHFIHCWRCNFKATFNCP